MQYDLKLRFPFDGRYHVTFPFGARPQDPALRDKYHLWGLKGHNGVDFALPEGTSVYAVNSGKVVFTGENGDFGLTVVLSHRWGQSLYAHLSKIDVEKGDKVKKHTKLGVSGSTGQVTGPHLHFQIEPKKSDGSNGYLGSIDPMPYFL